MHAVPLQCLLLLCEKPYSCLKLATTKKQLLSTCLIVYNIGVHSKQLSYLVPSNTFVEVYVLSTLVFVTLMERQFDLTEC